MREAFRVSMVLAKIILRGRALVLLVIALTLPVAIVSILQITAKLVSDTIGGLTLNYTGFSPLQISHTPLSGECVGFGVREVNVVCGSRLVKTLVYEVPDIGDFAEISGLKYAPETRSGHGVVVGEGLANLCGLKLNSNLTLSFSGECFNVTVQAIHRGHGGFEYAVIMEDEGLTPEMFFCRKRVNVVSEIVGDVGSSFNALAGFLTALTALVSAVVTYVAYLRVASMLEGEFKVLRELGVSEGKIRLSFIIASLPVSLMLLAYGLSVSLIATHLGLWVLRFTGALIPATPSLTLNDVLKTTFYFTLLSTAASTAVSRGIRC